MTGETKFFIGIILATIAIIIGAVLFFGKDNKTTSTTPGVKVNNDILIRNDSYKTVTATVAATLVEFGDFQCPACGTYHPIVKQLIVEFKDNLSFIFRNFPLNQHQNAKISAYAAEAAGNQGKYWQMHDAIYESQTKWSLSQNAKDIFIQYAQSLGMDTNQFKIDLDSDKIKKKVERDIADGNTAGVDATPTFFLNGEKLENPGSLEDFKTLIKAAIIKSPITQSPTEKYHAHVDFKVYVDGKSIDFSQAKYQSKEGKELNQNIHLHDNNGNTIHLHKRGITIGEFFTSLGIQLSNSELKMDTGEDYKNNSSDTLKMFVNGKENTQFGDYISQDLDRILISFGPGNDKNIQDQLASVTDTACMYSLKCPERGKPPTENCVGGLGSDCTD
ncbi:DsbA family protein [Candidatus Gottesmanbacteria bacterium]|nr:DsbA family protein [Candidatus Gottesmanbacteria bacterium]